MAAPLAAEASSLKLGYYKKTCRGWENVVKYHVAKAIKANRGVGAALVRLIFHDCFVRGCDASVLLDPTPWNPHTEKTAPINIGLAGFELIDEIKAALEERCPGTVSCSDIVVFAARDASSLLSNGHVHFDPPAGRLDGTVSLAADAQRDLPDSTFTIGELIRNFRRKNFTIEELVILSGAHAVGVGHCSSFRGRLTAPPSQIVPEYRNLLSAKCAAGPDPVVPNNVRDENPAAVAASFPSFVKKLRKFSFLDNSYYHNNQARIVTFNSDWQLLTEKEARGHVKEYADNGTLWDEDFSEALVKLSKLPMPPHSKGEIRKHCRVVNDHY
ncbi:Peroxidase 2 [Dichanthelium oligosanthes]|uniref:Peroxidase n=1 Tax=Dichanthelium oligosanthes TaxID=888268 RepID=A0A1E5W8X2_9POAL|nr:Peroxidase 2 [Dichanthelium oligosanthes]